MLARGEAHISVSYLEDPVVTTETRSQTGEGWLTTDSSPTHRQALASVGVDVGKGKGFLSSGKKWKLSTHFWQL